MCWTRKSHLQQQKALIKVLLLVLLSVDLLSTGNPYLCITFNKMEKYEPFPLLVLSIPFSPSNRFVFNRSFRNRMLYIRNLAAIFRKVGQLFTCLHLAIYDQNHHFPLHSISWCQRYVWLHYQRSTIACLHRLGAWIWYMQKTVRLRAKQKEVYQMYNVSFLFFWFNFLINHLLCSLWLDSWTHLRMDIRISVVPWHQSSGPADSGFLHATFAVAILGQSEERAALLGEGP